GQRARLRRRLRPGHEAGAGRELHRRPAAGAQGGEIMKVRLRVRMSSHDAHYGGDLVDGARVLGLFGDVGTELSIRSDGDEGLFPPHASVGFLPPALAGDFLEVGGEIPAWGTTSRKLRFGARRVGRARPDLGPSAAEILAEPIVVVRASGTCVTP